ncbi:transglutaminase-like domain-containing protein [Alteromonas aestuariivivens]|nr:transglutaminase-like domain-containing protein [Alteromonas aestuariivivens]
MAQLSIALKPEQSLPLSSEIRFELETRNPEAIAAALREWQGVTTAPVSDNVLAVTMKAQPQYTGSVQEQHSKASFVVDFDESATQEFVAGFKTLPGEAVRLEQLAEYVSEFMVNPTSIHGFNIASVVAAQQSGDCTEYAVLSTALARALGLPARVIVGSVIVELPDEVVAYGHAWAEVWHNERWNIVDAALYGAGFAQAFYLPASDLAKEGPGYSMSVINAVNLMPVKIRQLSSI